MQVVHCAPREKLAIYRPATENVSPGVLLGGVWYNYRVLDEFY